MDFTPYQALRARGLSRGGPWLEAVCELGHRRLERCTHGDFPRWRAALERLPPGEPFAELDRPAPRLGKPQRHPEAVREALMALHPWRKGPLEIHGVSIDAEWRSDLKWDRIEPLVDLGGRRVLDIGCGNGYFGWRMLAAGAALVIGVDPTWVYVMQWLACRQASGDLPNFVLPLGVEDLPAGPADFDTVFSMGVLYHRREPLRHLRRLHAFLRPGGDLVLESLVLPDDRCDEVLRPHNRHGGRYDGRYARMHNVWAIPGRERLRAWVDEAGFSESFVASVSETTPEEQRSTAWMRFESLDRALDPAAPGLTVEGHPAPRRAVLIARR